MVISILLIALSFSFCFQIAIIILYLSSKRDLYYKTFLGTFIINTILMVVTSTIALTSPVSVQKINVKFILWVISGLITLVLLFLQITIFGRVYRRSKDPNFFDINFFGKKVFRKGIIKQSEFLTFLLTIPFFLMFGSYFVARFINLLLYNRL
jgi:pheromone shutdown protein TraB